MQEYRTFPLNFLFLLNIRLLTGFLLLGIIDNKKTNLLKKYQSYTS